MTYRTKTYIAADWTGDKDAVDKLYEWKNNERLNLDFIDAHEYTQARDSSLNCSIKKSLHTRMDVSKKFVLIVGKDTIKLRNGSCQYCDNYVNSLYSSSYCKNNYSIDYRSYIEYECDLAIKANLRIIVLYNYANVDKSKCPERLRNVGVHINMFYYDQQGKCFWNYTEIKNAIND